MTIEYRRIRGDDEYATHTNIAAYAFNDARVPDMVEWRRRFVAPDEAHAAFDDGDMVAGLHIAPFQQYLNGAAIATGGIGGVSSLPERRRGGYVGGLLRHSLAAMREAGQCLSTLYTPHHALYGRFGWEAASRAIGWSFDPKKARLRLPPAGGRMRRTGPDDWAVLHDVYTRAVRDRNGPLVRSEDWWRNHVLQGWERTPPDAAVWADDAGDPRGYVVYKSLNRPHPDSPHGRTTFRIFDWCALDAESLSAILAYAMGHDLSADVFMLSSTDEPLQMAFEEPDFVQQRWWWGILLRIVDVQAALEARPALPSGSGRALTIALTDDTAPWNAGGWRVECSEGRISAERTDAAPQLSMDTRVLAPIYNGFVTPRDAALAGGVRVHDDRALDDAAAIFAVNAAPYCRDEF